MDEGSATPWRAEHDRLAELLASLSSEFGAPSEEEVAAALAEWGDS